MDSQVPSDGQKPSGKYDGLMSINSNIPKAVVPNTKGKSKHIKGAGAAATIDITGKFKDKDEQKLAQILLDRYLKDFELETISDRNTIQEVIYYEVLQSRIQEKVNDLYANNVKAIPYDMVGVMHKNSETIIKLKSTLGLNKANKERLVGYDAFDHWRKRMSKWLSENQAGRTMKCPHCEQFVLLKMRMAAWEAQKHPFFQDNTVYNRKLMSDLGKTVFIDEKYISEVLETSKDYVIMMAQKAKKPTTVGTATTNP